MLNQKCKFEMPCGLCEIKSLTGMPVMCNQYIPSIAPVICKDKDSKLQRQQEEKNE